MVKRVDRTEAGFTLVEMLVAVALAVIIMAMVMVAFAQGFQVSRVSQAQAEAIHSAWVAFDYLTRDLQGAFIEPERSVFLGVYDTSLGGVDNDRDGAVDELGEHAPDFEQMRHGMELLTSHRAGGDAGAQHVLYYVAPAPGGTTPDGRELGQLIRYSEPGGISDPLIPFIGSGLVGGGAEDEQVVALGVMEFRLRYYFDGVWFAAQNLEGWNSLDPDGWDSEPDTNDDVQFRRLPQAVEVTLSLVDMDGVLGGGDNDPVYLQQVIALPGY